jgi:hypothetical protein
MNTNLDPAASQRDPAKTPNVSELPIEVQGREHRDFGSELYCL